MLTALRTMALATILVATSAGLTFPAEESAPPATGSAPPPAIPTREAAQEQTVTKIAGLVVFVANSCPKLRPDYARFRSILHDLGSSEGKLAQPETKNRYLAYTAAYERDAAASCERARTQFGPDGSTVPDLFTVP